MDEKILCIKEETLFKYGKWNGLMTSTPQKYLNLLRENGEFRVRKELENDPSYKQIIAQVILRYKDKYFLHRQVKRNEERLNSLCPLPIGGHIEEIDSNSDDILETALERELHKEVDLKSNIISKNYLGLIYLEDDNPVNLVHVGFVYIFDLDGVDVHVKEEGLEDIGFVSLDYLKTNSEKLTYWSRIIIYHL
ncbi:MAG TPA: NUDIX domain-containing protein [Candidatus Dojkabacteria bacterium]|jgi:predicted NUDIX family phosphoesterase|nr:NUDIX domain-containing protein [Candidatus Dojkabacteria bacterium]